VHFDEPYTDIERRKVSVDIVANPAGARRWSKTIALASSRNQRSEAAPMAASESARRRRTTMRCSDDCVGVADIAERYDTAVHMHLLETRSSGKIARKPVWAAMVQTCTLVCSMTALEGPNNLLDDEDIACCPRGAR